MNEGKKSGTLNSILLADVPDIGSIEYLVEGLFLKTGLNGIVGASDIGKSSFVRQLMICVGNQSSEFLGHKLNAIHGKAIYVTSEDNAGMVKHLMQLQAEKLNQSTEFLSRVRVISESDDLVNNLNQHFRLEKFDLIVIDTYPDIFTGDINKATEVRNFLKPYQKIADENNCLVIFLHHLGKRRQNFDSSKDNIVGSQAFESKMRTIIELSEGKEDLLKRNLKITKGNYFSAEDKGKVLSLRFEDRCFFYEGQQVNAQELKKVNIKEDKDAKILEMLKERKTFTDIQAALKVSPSKIRTIKKVNGL